MQRVGDVFHLDFHVRQQTRAEQFANPRVLLGRNRQRGVGAVFVGEDRHVAGARSTLPLSTAAPTASAPLAAGHVAATLPLSAAPTSSAALDAELLHQILLLLLQLLPLGVGRGVADLLSEVGELLAVLIGEIAHPAAALPSLAVALSALRLAAPAETAPPLVSAPALAGHRGEGRQVHRWRAERAGRAAGPRVGPTTTAPAASAAHGGREADQVLLGVLGGRVQHRVHVFLLHAETAQQGAHVHREGNVEFLRGIAREHVRCRGTAEGLDLAWEPFVRNGIELDQDVLPFLQVGAVQFAHFGGELHLRQV